MAATTPTAREMPVGTGTRARIYKAAQASFIAKGYERTTLKDIAQAADVPIGNVYYYYENKEALFLQIVLDNIARASASIAEIAEQPLPVTERIHAAILDLVTSSVNSPTVAMLGSIEEILDALSPENAKVVVAARHRYEKTFLALVSEGAAEGAVTAADTSIAAFAVLGMATSCKRWFKRDGRVPLSTVARMYAELGLRALGAADPG